jgi:gamma-glutamylcyclotransferase (GGCT)/AIG2-like uncharacterized protein YtfP
VNKPYRIFVYGSLRSGEYNNSLLETSEKVDDGYINGFELVSLGSYPCIVPLEGNNQVIGEVWDVDPKVFPSIEGMELGAGYVRQEVIAHTGEGGIPADVYVYANPSRVASRPRVTHGDWCRRREEVA